MATVRKKTSTGRSAKRRARTKTKKSIRKPASLKPSPEKSVEITGFPRPSSKSRGKVKPKKKDTFNPLQKGKDVPLSFPHSVSLTILPVLNLPWDVNSIAIHTARFGGIIFIAFGAILTFMNLHYIGISAELVQNVTEVGQFAVICDTSDTNHVQDNTICNIGSGTYAVSEANVSSVIQSLPYNPFISDDLFYLGFSTFVVVMGLVLVVFSRHLYRRRKETSRES